MRPWKACYFLTCLWADEFFEHCCLLYIYSTKSFLRSFGPHPHPVLRSFLWFTWMNKSGYNLQIAHIKITSSSNSQTKFTSSQLQDRSSWSPSRSDPFRVHWAIKFYNRKRSGQAPPLGLWPVHMMGRGLTLLAASSPGPASGNLGCPV